MEEESLLKDRLQAIMDKKRIREDIRHKRRDIEEEKLKLQYIKKKSLREQWLMEGLHSEEEQETMKLQAQDELQRTTQLQSNILRMEKEVEDLEAEELNISTHEEEILKKLKQVERTTEDIIKGLCADPLSEVSWPSPLLQDSLSDIFMVSTAPNRSIEETTLQEPKRATFAMEFSVELNKLTEKTQIISAATVTPDSIKGKGLKIYEDGRKSMYVLHTSGAAEEVSEMTPTDVKELLHQTTNWCGDAQYHQPVHAATFTQTSRPSKTRISSNTTSSTFVCDKRIETSSLLHSRAESVYPELEGSKDSTLSYNVQRTDDINQSTCIFFGSVTTSRDSIPTQPSSLNTKHREKMDIRNLMNHDQLLPSYISTSPTVTFIKSKTPSRCSESVIEEFEKQNIDQALIYVNLVSEEGSSPIQPPFNAEETSSLQATHRYELDLIERLLTKCGTLPFESARENVIESKILGPEFGSTTVAPKSTSGMARQHIGLQSTCSHQKAALVSVRASSDGMPTPIKLVYKNVEACPPSPQGYRMDSQEINLYGNSLTYRESTGTLLKKLPPGAATMIFMGYEDVDEDEEDHIQVEVVVIGENEEEQDLTVDKKLSITYHPTGYTSQVYEPEVNTVKLVDSGLYAEVPLLGESQLHKPTFKHRAGKRSPCPGFSSAKE